MKKYIIAIIAVILLLCLCTLSVYAEEPLTVEGELVEQSTPIDTVTEDAPLGESIPFSEQVMQIAETYLSEIVSTLTFIGTLILGFLYKKGLLPTISAAFGKFSEYIKGMKEKTEKQIGEFNNAVAPVLEQIPNVIECCEDMKKSFDNMSEQLKKSEAEKKQLAVALNTSREANMLTAKLLSEVFACTNAPQYMKDKFVAYYEESKKLIEAPLKVVTPNDKSE
jgi:hypothetical protein